jgi:hypothetical protein
VCRKLVTSDVQSSGGQHGAGRFLILVLTCLLGDVITTASESSLLHILHLCGNRSAHKHSPVSPSRLLKVLQEACQRLFLLLGY